MHTPGLKAGKEMGIRKPEPDNTPNGPCYKAMFFNTQTLQETSNTFMHDNDKEAIKYCESNWAVRLKPKNKIRLTHLYSYNLKEKRWIEIKDWVLEK